MLFGGEPLMNWALIVKICAFKKKLMRPLTVYIMTNGALLDEEKILFLKENDIVLSISYDGSATNRHRKTALVKDLQKHLEDVFHIYKKHNYFCAITWCLCEDGAKDLEKDVKFLIDTYGETICNIDVNPVNLIKNGKLEKALKNVMKKFPGKVCGYYCKYCIKYDDCPRREGETRAVEVTHFSSDGAIYNDIEIKGTMRK